MSNPLVSVIIPSYNCAAYVSQAIDSVLTQTHKNIEIIVVDDGSADRTSDVIKPYLGRITYIKKENGGPAAARNAGIKKAHGEFIGFLDADDVWMTEKLERQIKILEDNPQVGLVSCSSSQIDPEGKIIGEYKYSNPPDYEVLKKGFFTRNMVGGGSSSLVRRECFDRLGLFDENLRGTEDWDMWLRISRRYDIRFVEEFLICSRIVPGSVSSVKNSLRMLENELKLLNKTFADPNCGCGYFLRQQSYSCRYFTAAKGLREAGALREALTHVLKSFVFFPPTLLNPTRLKTLMAIIFLNIKQKE